MVAAVFPRESKESAYPIVEIDPGICNPRITPGSE